MRACVRVRLCSCLCVCVCVCVCVSAAAAGVTSGHIGSVRGAVGLIRSCVRAGGNHSNNAQAYTRRRTHTIHGHSLPGPSSFCLEDINKTIISIWAVGYKGVG